MGKLVAVVDIGSNAVRLAIGPKKSVKEHFSRRLPLRLGSDTFLNGNISKENIKQLSNAILSMKRVAKEFNVESFRAVATSALREAKNRQQVLEQIKSGTGVKIELIDGVEEANIIHKLVHNYFKPVSLGPSLFMDIGGGSVELIFSEGRKKEFSAHSMKSGTVRLLSKSDFRTKAEVWDKIILNELLPIVKEHNQFDGKTFVGTGGNVRALQKLSLHLGINNKKRKMNLSVIKTLFSELTFLTYQERIEKLKLRKDRADVIVPATYIILKVMEHFNLKEIRVPKTSLKNGLILNS